MNKRLIAGAIALLLGAMAVLFAISPSNNDDVAVDVSVETGAVETGSIMYSPIIETGVIETGVIETGVIETGVIETGTIAEVVECNVTKEVVGMEVCATFKEDFVTKYKYEDSKGYRFALNIIGEGDKSIGYYNVFRSEAGGVANSTKDGLTGAIAAYDINDGGYCWEIPLNTDINLSRESGEYGYITRKLTKVPQSYSFKLSPTKEVAAEDIADMKNEVIYKETSDCEIEEEILEEEILEEEVVEEDVSVETGAVEIMSSPITGDVLD